MKQIICLLLAFVALVTTAGCSKKSDDTPTPTGPKEYQVEYRVSSINTAVAGSVIYTNDTGSLTSLSNIMLPATYSYKRIMKQYDTVSILASGVGTSATSEITCTILLDGKEVKKETARGTTIYLNMVYLIP